MHGRRLLIWLLLVALLLPIALCVVLGLAQLLAALQDEAGARAVRYAAMGLAVVWVVDLIVLLLTHVVVTLDGAERREGGE